jgi:riboflavin biosynthesis pyrimidine reductase
VSDSKNQVRQLFPTASGSDSDTDVNADVVYGDLADRRAAAHTKPYLIINMVESVDGAISVDGLSGGLSSAADKAVFSYLRSLADIVLVGASTAREEGYNPPKLPSHRVAERLARGQQPLPRIALVSASMKMDWSASLFSVDPARDPQPQPPIVICPEDTDPKLQAEAQAVAEVITAGHGRVDCTTALAKLHDGGAKLVLCEGGPAINGQLFDAGLVDELCLTLSPALVGGLGRRISGTEEPHESIPLELLTTAEAGGMLLLRYAIGQSAR